MLKRPAFTLIVAVLLAAAFLYGIMQLFSLGYRAGHVYPPYSSLRADPLGTKVLYEALAELPGVALRRNFRALPRLDAPEPITLVYAGLAQHVFWEPKELDTFEMRVRGGARGVIAFFPEDRPAGESERERAARLERNREKFVKKDERQDEEGEMKELLPFGDVARRWGFRFDDLPPDEKKTFARTAVSSGANGALERQISWHSAICFTDLRPDWTTLYTSDGQPVVIERKFGAGSIVLAGDSFFLSNEALRAERHPVLLGHIFSGPPRIIFDEEHLGVSEQPGIANLAGKYRLHGAIATLALIAALFVWMNAVPFLPPREDPTASGVVTGKESAEGFVNLLRRTIRPAELLNVCVEEWRKTSTLPARDRGRVEEAWAAEQTRPAKDRDPVAAYRVLSQTITRKT